MPIKRKEEKLSRPKDEGGLTHLAATRFNGSPFRDGPETEQEIVEWLAQVIADRAIERMNANGNT